MFIAALRRDGGVYGVLFLFRIGRVPNRADKGESLLFNADDR